MEVLSYLLYI